MRHRLQALSLAVALAALLAIKPLPAHAEKVQIDPTFNTVQCSNCSAAGGGAGAASTDASGTVATGGSYQTVLASNGARKGCLIQNPSTATEALNLKVGTMANPFVIPIGGSFSCAAGSIVLTDALTLTAATTGHAFAAVSQ